MFRCSARENLKTQRTRRSAEDAEKRVTKGAKLTQMTLRTAGDVSLLSEGNLKTQRTRRSAEDAEKSVTKSAESTQMMLGTTGDLSLLSEGKS